jgi:outer membrane protein
MHSFLRALGAASLLVTAATAPLAAQAAPQKFAYVDTRRILDQAPGRPEAEAQLAKEVNAMQDQLKKMGDQLTQMMSDYSKLPSATPQADKDKREKAIRDKQAEAQQKQNDFQTQAQQREAELLQPILDQIKLVLEDIRAENNYTMLFDVGQGASIVAADKNLDISDRVIAKLRTMPKPVIAAKTDSARADARKPAGAPLAAPAGVRPPGTNPPPAVRKPDSTAAKKPDSTAAKKPDSTVTKKPDSTVTKKPDSTVTKKPDAPSAAGTSPSGA